MKLLTKIFSITALLGVMISSYAVNTVSVPMYLMGKGQLQKLVGTVVLTDSPQGLRVQPNLKDLAPTLAAGSHTIVIQSGSCPDALHSQLNSGGTIAGNWPAMMVDSYGVARSPVFINNLSVDAISNQVVVIQGGDNGQGYHIVCGMVPMEAKQLLGTKS